MYLSLDIRKLTKKYTDKVILNNIDLEVPKGTFNLLVGNNGSGKTTLLKIISGLIKPSNGKIIYDDNLKISYQPENLYSKVEVKVYNLLKYLNGFELNPRTDKGHLERLLLEFGLNKYNQYKVSELSHGYLKRLLILQALMINANLYLFDEPLDGLDEEFKSIFLNIIVSLKNEGKTIILVTHDPKIFKDITDHLIYLSCGKISGFLNIKNLRSDQQMLYELIIIENGKLIHTEKDKLKSEIRFNSVNIESIDKLFITINNLLEKKNNISELILKHK